MFPSPRPFFVYIKNTTPMSLTVNVVQIFLILTSVIFPFSEAQPNKEDVTSPSETLNIVDQFEFEVESTGYLDVRSMDSYHTMSGWRDNALVKLNKEELTKLCLRVKNYLSLDGMVFPDDKSFYPFLDKMAYPGTNSEYYIGMSCATIPKSWIRVVDGEKNKIMIMIQDWYKYQNGNYTFEIRSVKPYQVRKQRNYNKELDGWDSSKYWDSELICFFAKKRVKELNLIPEEPLLQRPETEEYAMYDMDLLHASENRIAILCPSTPRMYAYYDTYVDRHIIALLVDENSQTLMSVD